MTIADDYVTCTRDKVPNNRESCIVPGAHNRKVTTFLLWAPDCTYIIIPSIPYNYNGHLHPLARRDVPFFK